MSIADAGSRIDTERVYGAALSSEAILSLGSMEGVYDPVVTTPAQAARPAAHAVELPGYLAAGAVVGLAYAVHYLPLAPFTAAAESGVRHPVSAAIIAILLGLALRNTLALPDSLRAGCKHIVKKVIPMAIVLMGAGLNLAAMASIGLAALTVVMFSIAIGVLAGYYIGRFMGLNWRTSLLLGTGTGICGNSAIAAVAPLIDAEEDDFVLSVATVNLFSLLAMLAWPAIGGLLHLGDEAFGVWAGTSIHAVPQVVAAGFAYSPEAGALATLVKLVRVTMLAPLVFILAMMYARDHADDTSTTARFTVRYARLVPWFVWGFVGFAVLNTLGLLPVLEFRPSGFLASIGVGDQLSVSIADSMKWAGKILITLAMAAIGLEVNLRVLAGVGRRAFLAGLLTTVVLGVASLTMISFLM
ncbi:MAG: putative sulfate exporter family transporter [Planctomycetes bacterium]|nr:putative sulfate exporter family transporter [Planctomycetota bacterium]